MGWKRKLGIGFGIAAGAVGAGCAEDVAVADAVAEMEELAQAERSSRWSEEELERKVENEVRKHDSWTVDIIKSSSESKNPVTIGKYGPAFKGNMREWDTNNNVSGIYSGRTKIVYLYPGEELIDSIDHEFWHSLEDMIREGILKIKQPDRGERKRFCNAQREMPPFKGLEAKSKLYFKIKNLQMDMAELMVKKEKVMGWFLDAATEIELDKEKEYNYDADFVFSHRHIFRACDEGRRAAYDKLTEGKGLLSLSIEQMHELLSVLKKAHDKYKSEFEWFQQISTEFIEKYQDKIPGYEKRGDICLDNALLDVDFRRHRYRRIDYTSMVDSIASDEELIARAFDGLASIYLGPAELDIIPITPESIALFEQYKLEDGTLVFRKLIERGKVALQMQEDGVNPEEIKRQLEYAESFTYRGVTYDWKESEFWLEDEIPNFAPLTEYRM